MSGSRTRSTKAKTPAKKAAAAQLEFSDDDDFDAAVDFLHPARRDKGGGGGGSTCLRDVGQFTFVTVYLCSAVLVPDIIDISRFEGCKVQTMF